MSVLQKCEVLREMFESGMPAVARQRGMPAAKKPMIGLANAEALYRCVTQNKPRTVVEIGMAYGASTLSILAGLKEVGEGGKLISVDPVQSTHWKGVGAENVRLAGFASSHRLVEKTDFEGLPQLIAEGVACDLGYIDGHHSFDYAFIDFFFLDKLTAPGGIVAFNDAGFHAVHKVIKFVQSHHKYSEIDVGLPNRSSEHDTLRNRLRRRLGRAPFMVADLPDRYFRKREEHMPAWNFFAEF